MTFLRVLSVWFALRAFVSILSDMVRFSDPHSHRQHTRAPRYSTTVAPNEAAQAKQLIMSQPDALNAKKKASHPHAFPQLSLSFAALVWMSRGALLTCLTSYLVLPLVLLPRTACLCTAGGARHRCRADSQR
jgi:hypothetical protein